jgi:multicomponent Na+:H+ antiporter subunit D
MNQASLLLNLLITWLLFPFGAAFVSALLPSLGRGLNLLAAASTLVVGTWAWLGGNLQLNLIGELGVQLQVDRLAAPFLLLNGLVVLAVLLDRWRRLPPGPFLLLLLVLLGGLNSAFLAIDLVSLYVALEVVGITAFLLILQKRDGRQLWIALRYLLISNSVMTLYLVGVALLYLQVGSFRIASLVDLPAGDQGLAVILALLLVGLLTKSGLFLAGLWLPRTHAEAPAEVSALLSGVVVAGGLCPLLRLNAQLPGLQPLLAWVGLGSAVLGLVYALLETDLKRLLAWSTLSQLGLVLLNPLVGGAYALAHGLAKATLFLVAGHVPSRRLASWARQPLPPALALPLLLAALSIAGAPLLLGYWSKQALFTAPLTGFPGLPVAWAGWLLPLLSVGTAAVYARICWLPLGRGGGMAAPGAVLLAVLLLAAGVVPLLLPASTAALPLAALPLAAIGKALAVLAAGAGVEALRQLALTRGLPGLRPLDLEQFGDLLGAMAVLGAGLVVVLLGWPEPLALEREVLAWRG